MTIRAAFFDVDGTQVDTEPRNRRAIEEVAASGGHIIKPADWDELAGTSDGLIFEKIAETDKHLRAAFNTASGFEAACLKAKLAHIDEVKKIPETAAAMKLLKANGIGLAAVSNSITADAAASLKAAGYAVKKIFDFSLFRDELNAMGLRSKPYPDPYLQACKMMDKILHDKAGADQNYVPLRPSECLVMEDSKTGVRAGLAAGMSVVHLTDESGPLDPAEVRQMLAGHEGATYNPVTRSQVVDKCKQLIAGHEEAVESAIARSQPVSKSRPLPAPA